MTRPNRFLPIHKALRAALFETAALVARTDFASDDEAPIAPRAVGSLLELFDSHA